ncbi:hypothetical protein, partial [Escherichia coli]|uniref:hypothetical protein n=1 Tax=Escherichia coli TaxID=562 RepID=UPI002927C781
GGAFAVTHHPFISLTGGTAYINISHWSTSKTPSYTKSVSWHHHPLVKLKVPGSTIKNRSPFFTCLKYVQQPILMATSSPR